MVPSRRARALGRAPRRRAVAAPGPQPLAAPPVAAAPTVCLTGRRRRRAPTRPGATPIQSGRGTWPEDAAATSLHL